MFKDISVAKPSRYVTLRLFLSFTYIILYDLHTKKNKTPIYYLVIVVLNSPFKSPLYVMAYIYIYI
jgi:hypothetical protein